MAKNNDYLVKAKEYLAAMKTMYNLEQLADGVRPDKYKYICQKYGIDENEAMNMYSVLQKMKKEYYMVNYKKSAALERVLAIAEEAYVTYKHDRVDFYVELHSPETRYKYILVSFRKPGEKLVQQEFNITDPKTFPAVTDMMNSGFEIVGMSRQADEIESTKYDGVDDDRRIYIPIYDGDVLLCYLENPDSIFSHHKECGLYLCHAGVYHRLVYTPGKGYVRHHEPDEDEDFELDISEESFSQYVLTLSKRFRKLGNIHSGIGFLMEEDNKEKEK